MYKPLIVASVLSLATIASASPCNLTGNVFGTVFQNSIDLNGDGFYGRSGLLRARNGGFAYLEVNVDSALTNPASPQGACASGEVEITPYGQLAFSSLDGSNALFAVVDSSRHLCVGLHPEAVKLQITGGRGAYSGATGTGSVLLPDDVVLSAGLVPQVVYTHNGSFSLRVN